MKIDVKKMKRFLTLFLVLALALTVLAGCGDKDTSGTKDKDDEEVSQNEGGNEGKNGGKKENKFKGFDVSEGKYGVSYPLDAGDVELTYWRTTTAAVQKSAPNNYGDLPFAKELEKQTGVKVKYIHPSLTNAAEKFTLMISSGDLTDIIGNNFSTYTGGAQAAIDDGVIQQLNVEGNNMLEAWAPDYNALLHKYPDTVLKEAKTNSGAIYSFGLIAPDQELNTTAGPIVRGDWLEELVADGTLDFEDGKPHSIDDWYKMLKAFREKKGATAPLSATSGFYNGFISGAYGTNLDFYRDGNEVKYAPMEKGYEEYLTTMNKWYKEGLFDSGFDTKDGSAVNAQLLNGSSGATWNAIGGGIGTLMSNVENKEDDDANKDAVFIGVQYPTLDGGKSEFGQIAAKFNPTTCISTQCKDPELAVKWLNYGYTKKGHMLFNFGIEGVSYEMVNGYPTYTDEVKSNPTLTMQEAFAKYSQAGGAGGVSGYRQDVRYLEQYTVRPQQKEAHAVWCDTNAFDHYVPNTGIAEENAKEYSMLYTNITTYVSEEYIKFIKGDRPLSEFDDFRNTLKEMGVEKMIRMKQEAYDAYLAR